MTNPTPSEFDAKLDGILKADLLDFFKAYEKHSYEHPSEPFVIDDWKHTKAKAAIRAAVREMVPKKHKERPYKFFSGGYESELAAYVDGFNNAIAEVLAGIGTDDGTN